MLCTRCKGAGVLARRATRVIEPCPQCDGTGTDDLADLAGSGIAEGGAPRPLPPAIRRLRIDRPEACDTDGRRTGAAAMIRRLVAALAVALLIVTPAAAETLAGPFLAEIVRVYDGDTFQARIRIWLGQDVLVWVRLIGVDTPELGRRARCPEENARARAARDYLAGLLGGAAVVLTQVKGDKYAGRVDAVVTAHGTDVAQALVGAGYGRPYDGRARQGWCG